MHIKEAAQAKGFLTVAATPMTRSSYHADAGFEALREARQRVLDRNSEQQTRVSTTTDVQEAGESPRTSI